MKPRPSRAALLISAGLALAACAPSSDGESEPVAEAEAAISVQEASDSTCSTVSVKGLSEQIVAVADCLSPGAYVEIPPRPNLDLGGAVFPYMEAPARDALLAALDEHPGTTMTVNSMLRTVAQQYLLYQWYLQGDCGIGLAAKPGGSNHETGLAIDISEYSAWRAALEQHDFVWYGASDPVHFDYDGADAVDYKGTDVLAFQVLWNAHHPGDVIDEDGVWGPQTQARLQQSPAEGFTSVPSCGGGGAGGGSSSSSSSSSSSTSSSGAGGAPSSSSSSSGSTGSTGGTGGGDGGSGGGGGEGGAVAPDDEQPSGCACVAAGGDAPPGALVGSALAASMLAAIRRRRRRRVAC